MVGRKANLKLLVSKARAVGASVVKTTEFVQGQTARWGLAWSFIAPRKMVVRSSIPGKVHYSFMLQVGNMSPFFPLIMHFVAYSTYVQFDIHLVLAVSVSRPRLHRG
jgi:hypothetical protein